MNTIDTRVVEMKFNNAEFKKEIAATLTGLENLEKGLKLDGASRGLEAVAAASQHVELSHIGNAVDNIAGRFSAMSVVAITALTNITNRAITAGTELVKSLTIAPIMAGFHEYETNLNAIQTILANTGLEGKKGLATVNHALDELNHYSDQTIYNFSEMAKNIGTFTAAGVSLDTSTAAIKGIANLAAVSGSNAEQASAAMYQLSQALSAGRLTLEDWNSVVNAGMGGKVFQNALTETARTHGVAIDKMIKDEGSFRLTLQKGWLTSDILTETLSKFTGDLNAKQLKSMGYSKDQIEAIIKMGKTAQDAATKVKTFSQLINTLQEAVGSGWSKTWQTLFGDFGEAKTLFTGVNNVLGGFINASSDARNKVLGDWKALGGRTALIKAIGNVFTALLAVIKPIKDAFRSIFPATTGKQLYAITVAIRDFTEKLKIGGETATNLKRTFAGFFAVLDIGWMIIKEVAKTFFKLIGMATEGSGGFLKFTGNIGDFLVSIRDAIKYGDGLSKVFEKIGVVLGAPIMLVKTLASFLGSLFSGFNSGNTGNGFLSFLSDVGSNLEVVKEKLTSFFGGIGDVISSAFEGITWGGILSTINTGLFAGLAVGIGVLIKKVMGLFSGGEGGFGLSDIIDPIKGAFEQLTDTMKAMQNTLRAATLIEIALAIGVLTVSVVALSKIDSAGLTRALTAMAVMFTELFVSMAIFEKVTATKGFAKMPLVAAAMILLGIAVNVLASAVKKLAGLDWEGLAKGLIGLTVILGTMIATVRLMPDDKKLISTSLGLIVLSQAIKLLVSSVTDLGALSWDELGRGLTGLAGVLTAVALFSKINNANKVGLLQGAGLILIATGIKMLADAINVIGKLSWDQIARGLVGIATSLGLVIAAMTLPDASIFAGGAIALVTLGLTSIATSLDVVGKLSWEQIAKGVTGMLGVLAAITGALLIVPPTALTGAAGMLIVSYALVQIADVLGKMGDMSWEGIAKGLIALGGAMLIIAVSMLAMDGALPGAAALVVVIGALTLLVPILQALGNMSWEQVGKGLLVLAGAFAILGVAGLLLTPVVPTLLGLAAAITLLGVGLALAGAGMFLFGVALTALAAAGTAGTAALVNLVTGLAGVIPEVMKQLGLGLVAFANVIATSGPAFTKAIVTVLNSLIDAIDKLAPKIAATMLKLLTLLLKTLEVAIPRMIRAGLNMISGILQGISDNIGKITKLSVEIITKFINGIANGLPKIIQSGFNLIIKFIEGITKAINDNSEKMGKAGGDLAIAIVKGLVNGIRAGVGQVVDAAKGMASNALDAVKQALGIASPSKEFEKIGKFVNDGFVKGLRGNKDQVYAAFNDLKNMLRDAVRSAGEDVKELEAKLKKLTSARKKDNLEISKTAKALYDARLLQMITSQTYTELTKKLNDERTALGKLATQYDIVSQKLKNAQSVLDDAKRTRDDYNKSVKDQYASLPEITGETKVGDFINNLAKQVNDTKLYVAALAKLRSMGLNDAMYKQLLEQGPSALPFVQELLAGGKASIDQINALGKQLESVATKLGKTASSQLYQAAVDAAAGFVKGLQSQLSTIEKMMVKLADAMVAAVKKKLGIKSPSRVFAELGRYSGEGLAKGLSDSSSLIEKSTENIAVGAIKALRDSMSGMSDIITRGIETDPTIRPVLDLTAIKKDVSQIGGMLNGQTLSIDTSLSAAKLASIAYMTDLSALPHDDTTPTPSLTFNQYNNSPKALSDAEIYRQTKNQLSIAKGAQSK